MLDSDGKFCNWVNYYKCYHEDSYEEGEPAAFWTDNWSATCNDRCPVCNHEIEPYHSVEIEEYPYGFEKPEKE